MLFLAPSSAGNEVSLAFLALIAKDNVSDEGCGYTQRTVKSEDGLFVFLILPFVLFTVGGHSSLQDN